jgi:hypothetical protein
MHGWLQISKSGFKFGDVGNYSVIAVPNNSGVIGSTSVAIASLPGFTSMPMCSFVAETAMEDQLAEPFRCRC